MDRRLLEYYEQELRFLKEQGKEFAAEHPAVADRLALDEDEVADPYVRHLLQAFAFLSARVSMRFDDEFPTLSQGLLQAVDPDRVAQTPSAAIVEFEPETAVVAKGQSVVARGLPLRAKGGEGRAECRFMTCHDVTVRAVRMAKGRYIARDLPTFGVPIPRDARAAIALTLESSVNEPINRRPFDELTIYLHGGEDTPGRLLEAMLADPIEVIARPTPGKEGASGGWTLRVDNGAFDQLGFDREEAMLPVNLRAFDGSRILQEHFMLPRRCSFVRLTGLQEATSRCDAASMELVIPLRRRVESLEPIVSADNFRLYCTPAVNLFERTSDRIEVERSLHEHLLIPDRANPMDCEVFSVRRVMGYAADYATKTEFRPFFAASDQDAHGSAYYSVRRVVPRFDRSVTAQSGSGAGSKYRPSQVHLSIVDARNAPYSTNLKQLEARVLCTSGLAGAELAAKSAGREFTLAQEAPIKSVRVLAGPSAPREANTDAAQAWRLISRLTLHHLPIVGGEAAAATMRSILRLFTDPARRDHQKQVEGLVSVDSEVVTRPIIESGRLAWCRGLRVSPTFDEESFTGVGVFPLASAMERFLGEFTSINSFVETQLCSQQRGEIKTWPARAGRRRIL